VKIILLKQNRTEEQSKKKIDGKHIKYFVPPDSVVKHFAYGEKIVKEP